VCEPEGEGRCVHCVPACPPSSPEKVTAMGLDERRRFGSCIEPEENERRRRGSRAWGEAGRACAHDEEA
jgi:hypothetical protein